MATIAVTGSAGGIGAATRSRLEGEGHTVIGIDLRDAEVIADLSTRDGRASMVEEVTDACRGALDGVVAGAGVEVADQALVVALNYFGAVSTIRDLRALLARGTEPSAVAIGSNSATTASGIVSEVVQACLEDDEDRAREAATGGTMAYMASKLALARWVRRNAVGRDWAGAGIRLNAVAPGLVRTAMTEANLDLVLNLGDVFPIPLGRAAEPDEVASLLAYLLSPEAGFFCGSVVYADGGTDAALRPDDWPAPLTR